MNNLNVNNLKSNEYCISNGFPCCKCGLGYDPGCNRKRVRPQDLVKFIVILFNIFWRK